METLLLVEDSPTQLKIIRQRFESLTRFSLLSAYSLQEAMVLVDAHRNDIFAAVADLNLPDAPHGEAVALCLEREIPCIVLAASFDEDVRKQFLDKHVADYFLKGTIDELESLVCSVKRLYANYSVKALVVDDSSTQRKVIKHLLKVQCIESLDAEDGIEALEILKQNPEISLVIADYKMPRMDGVAFLQEIRQTRSFAEVAVIGLSSVGSGSLTAQFLKYGANDYITMPFETEEFYWRINQTLNIMDAMRQRA